MSDDAAEEDRIKMVLPSGMTKRIDATWAAGTGVGGRTGSYANGTYPVFLFRRSDGSIDVTLADSMSPTLPDSGTHKRRIGFVIVESSANVQFVQYTHDPRVFMRNPVRPVESANPGTAAVLQTVSVPVGAKVGWIGTVMLQDSTPGGSNTELMVNSPDNVEITPTTSAFVAPYGSLDVANGRQTANFYGIQTDTSGRVRTKLSRSDADVLLRMITHGWIDDLGMMG